MQMVRQLQLFDDGSRKTTALEVPRISKEYTKHYLVARNPHSYEKKWPELIADMQKVIEMKGWVTWADLKYKWDLGRGKMYVNLFNRIRLAVFPKSNIKKIN
ncbi:hypothetical protein [Chondrinema litorale]|uniref:hypothetical protein n=1 Tax=Chondrinema litorale TaxID=2994555 RepID=UPI002543CE7E|nr:hypothetical protein [Chondrinema litorale]UZR93165.1 hypothetical protein OQ292_14995 [Chondrinema litorale]